MTLLERIQEARDVAVFLFTLAAGVFCFGWWAGDKTAHNEVAAAMECPAGQVWRRTIDYTHGTVICTYYAEAK